MQRKELKIEDLGALWDLNIGFFLADTGSILFENIILTSEIV